MQYCSEMAPGGMLAVKYNYSQKLPLAVEAARKWVKEMHGIEEPVCKVAAFHYRGKRLIAGHKEVWKKSRSTFK